MNWLFICAAAQKDIRQLFGDPWKLLLWLGAPLLIGVLMTTLMGGSDGPKPQAILYLDDRDESLVSGLLAGAFSNEGLGDLVLVERMPREQALLKLNANLGSAVLTIPPGFGDAVLQAEPTELELLTNPAQRILPGILEEVLSILREGVFYLHQVLGDELALMLEGPEPGSFTLADPKVARIAVQINGVVSSLSEFLDPPLLSLESGLQRTEQEAEAGEAQAASSKTVNVPASFYMFPSVLLMAMFFVALGLSESFWTERDEGTLRRSLCSPQRVSAILAGKLLSALLVFIGLGIVLMTMGYLYHDFLAWAHFPLALLWWSSGGVAVFALLSIVQMLCTTRRGGSIMSNLLMFPLLMLGGSFFPFEAMPSWMAEVGAFTPNGWILAELKPILLGKHSIGSLAPAWAGLSVGGVILVVLLRARLRQVMYN